MAMGEFYRGEDSFAKAGERKNRAVYSFEYDDKYIYSGFLSQYGIDLCTADLHWYKFKALFSAFGDDVTFVKIMQYRSMDLGKIKDKEQKKFYRKMKRLYALPDNRTDDEKEKDIIAGLEML